jgi:hypothetical protein
LLQNRSLPKTISVEELRFIRDDYAFRILSEFHPRENNVDVWGIRRVEERAQYWKEKRTDLGIQLVTVSKKLDDAREQWKSQLLSTQLELLTTTPSKDFIMSSSKEFSVTAERVFALSEEKDNIHECLSTITKVVDCHENLAKYAEEAENMGEDALRKLASSDKHQ